MKICLSWQQLGLSKTGSICFLIHQFPPCFYFPEMKTSERGGERERERERECQSFTKRLQQRTVWLLRSLITLISSIFPQTSKIPLYLSGGTTAYNKQKHKYIILHLSSLHLSVSTFQLFLFYRVYQLWAPFCLQRAIPSTGYICKCFPPAFFCMLEPQRPHLNW